ncbi:glycoside hydrolase family 18 protein [Apiospora aurea]|uniref:chitinase n=1 Tax=Apiospora aurea TaxID=335848 RepID=A0ABR1PWZ1_9PEZI
MLSIRLWTVILFLLGNPSILVSASECDASTPCNTGCCGNKEVERPSCSVDSHKIKRVVGYYEAWSNTRACNTMPPLLVPQGVYTHINFAFASIDPETFQVIPAAAGDEALYKTLNSLKFREPQMEVWLSIGRSSFDNANKPTPTTLSDLARSDIIQQNVFFSSLAIFMLTYGFTGVDIDWEYPVAANRNGRPEDFETLPKFLSNLRSSLDDYGYGLSITIPTSFRYLQHFDLAAIEPPVDWFNLQSYDLHGAWGIGDEWNGAHLNGHTNLTEIETALDLVWRNGIDSSKQAGLRLRFRGEPGQCSRQTGILLNSEIAEIIREESLEPVLWKEAAVKTIAWGTDQWVSFDDKDTFKLKGDFAKSQCLGGVMVWALSHDDRMGTNAYGLAEALGNPLRVGKEYYNKPVVEKPQAKYCRWGNCGEECGNGFTHVRRDGNRDEHMFDGTGCPKGSVRTFCCPNNSPVPTCQWSGHRPSGNCKGGCASGQVEVGSTNRACHNGHQAACCDATPSTAPWSKCNWSDCQDDDDTCTPGYPNFVVSSSTGSGGMENCRSGKTRSYCCQGDAAPEAFTNCEWYARTTHTEADHGILCTSSCPLNTIMVAEEHGFDIFTAYSKNVPQTCKIGGRSFCCSGPSVSDPVYYKDHSATDFDNYLQKFLKAYKRHDEL